MLSAPSTRAGSANQMPLENDAPKRPADREQHCARAAGHDEAPECAPDHHRCGDIGVSQAGSSVPASISRLKLKAISQNAVSGQPAHDHAEEQEPGKVAASGGGFQPDRATAHQERRTQEEAGRRNW